jgi:CRISPR-associated protein Cas2
MTVIILERVTAGLRGDLTRWLLEPRTGVFVGSVSAMVRDRLWERVCEGMRGGAGMLIYTTDTEQGFAFRLWGDPSRVVRDFEGLALVTIPSR